MGRAFPGGFPGDPAGLEGEVMMEQFFDQWGCEKALVAEYLIICALAWGTMIWTDWRREGRRRRGRKPGRRKGD